MDEDKLKDGYIKFYRRVRDSDLWQQQPFSPWKLFEWLLFEAAHKGNAEKKGLEPGQVPRHSMRFIQDEMIWFSMEAHKKITPSMPTIYKALGVLKAAEMIEWTTLPGVKTVINICNWGIYQEETEGVKNAQKNSEKNSSLYDIEPVKNVKEVRTDSLQNLPPTSDEDGADEEKPDPKITQAEKDLLKVQQSLHWPYLERLVGWFYGPDVPNTPAWEGLTPTEQAGALKAAELILRKDMEDAEDCEQRLGRILKWAVEDDFWAVNVQALPPLRHKKAGIYKWADLEKRMQAERSSPNGRARKNRSSPKVLHDTFARILDRQKGKPTEDDSAGSPQRRGDNAGFFPDPDEFPTLGAA